MGSILLTDVAVLDASGAEPFSGEVQVREGYLADLLLVDGNPHAGIGIMADRTRFAMLMKDGAICKDPRAYVRDVRIAAE